MGEILQSEIITVLLDYGGTVSFAEFAGLFHQIHGYQFKLANYGYTSLRKLLEDMKDIQLCQINGEQFMRCQVVEQIVVQYHSCKEKDNNNSQISSKSLCTSGPSSGLPKTSQKDNTWVKQTTGKKSKKSTLSTNTGCSSKAQKTDKSSKTAASLDSSTNVSKHLTRPNPISSLSSSSVSTNTSLSATKPKSAINLGCASSLGTSASCGPSTRPKSVGKTAPTSKLKTVGPLPRHRPTKTQPKSMENNSYKANLKSVKSKTTALNNKASLNTTVKNTVSKLNVNSSGTGAPTRNTQPAGGQSQKITIIPNNNCFNRIHTNLNVHPGLSYAAVVCTSDIRNQSDQNRQQFVTNNRRSNNHIPNGMHYRSTPEPNSVIPSSAVKNNIQSLLEQHAHGLSIFQLQKMYLFKFHEPLARKGFPSVKQLLWEMKDLVRLQGVGVQVLVFPATAGDIPSIANRCLDKANTQNADTDYMKDSAVSAQFISSSKTVASSSLLGLAQKLDNALTQNDHTLKDIKQLAVPSEPKQDSYAVSQNQAGDANLFARPKEKMLVPPENVLHPQSHQTAHHMQPPSPQTPQEMHRRHNRAETPNPQAQKDADMITTRKGPEQIASKTLELPQFVLHSSGFSLVMNERNVSHDTENSKNISQVPTAGIRNSLNSLAQATSDIDNRRSRMQKTVTDTFSKLLEQPKMYSEKQQMSYTNKINQYAELLPSPPHQPMHDTLFAVTEQPKPPLTRSQLQVDDSQGINIHDQMESQSTESQQNRTNIQNTTVLERSTSSEPQAQHVRQDFMENALQPSGSTASQLQDNIFHLQTSGVSENKEQILLEQTVSNQSQQKVTNRQVENEAKQSVYQQSLVKGGHSQTNDVSQSLHQSPNSQLTQKPINIQDRNERRQTESVTSQPHETLVGSHTEKYIGQEETTSSPTKQTKKKRRKVSPAAHPHEKGPISSNKNPLVSPALHSKQKESVFPNKNLSEHASSQPIKDFHNIGSLEEAIASSSTITLPGKILPVPLTPQYQECTNESSINGPYQHILDSQVNIPGQYMSPIIESIPQNCFESSEDKEMKTWQTTKDQSCCIL